MAQVRCVDGSVLTVLPVPVLDRDGAPYEVTLRMLRDDVPFGQVGERCGWFLATTAARLRVAREGSGPEALPASSLEAGLRGWAVDGGVDPDRAWDLLERYLPRDRELFAFHARDPDDRSEVGELRVWLRVEPSWSEGPGPRGLVPGGRWQLRHRAVLDAWGSAGQGVRAVLDSAELLALLEDLVRDCAHVGVTADLAVDLRGVRRPVG